MKFKYKDSKGEEKEFELPDDVFNAIKTSSGDNDVEKTLERYNMKIRQLFPELLSDASSEAKVVDLLNTLTKKFEELKKPADPADSKPADDISAQLLELKKQLTEKDDQLKTFETDMESKLKKSEAMSQIRGHLLASNLDPGFEDDLDYFLQKKFSFEEDTSGNLTFIDAATDKVISVDGKTPTFKQVAEIFIKDKEGMFRDPKGGLGLNGDDGSGGTDSKLNEKSSSEDLLKAGISEIEREK